MNRDGFKVECSVVMPCFNAKAYIGKSIDSVREQTFKSWELIIVDDGSSDGSAEFVKDNYAATDPRIILIQLEKNTGAAVARNVAIERAQGRFIAFLDSDDEWTSDKLEMQVGFMRKYDYPFTFTAYRRVNEENIFLNDVGAPESVTYQELLKTNVIGCLTAVYDTKVLGKVYMPQIRKPEDFGLWLRLLKLTPKAYGLGRCLAFYKVRNGSESSNKAEAARHTWLLYRRVEKLPFMKSVYYFMHYAARGVIRTKYPRMAKRLGLLD